MRNKELIKWFKSWKLRRQILLNSAYMESMELGWENLPTRHLSCLGLKGLITTILTYACFTSRIYQSNK